MLSLSVGVSSPLPAMARPHRRRGGLALGSRRFRTHASAVQGGLSLEESSERDLSLVLKRRWDVLLQPASYNTRHSVALKNFVDACILAYSTGYSEEFIKQQTLAHMMEGEPSASPSESVAEELQLLGTAVSLVFITIQSCPSETIQRWSTAAAVSALTRDNWKGFVGLIVNAYFKDGMAWYPIDRLMMVQSATLGFAERPEAVAERMSVVYQTLNTVSPRFPSRFET